MFRSTGDIRYFLRGLRYHFWYWISHAVLLTYFTQICFIISCNICQGAREKNWSSMFSLLEKEKAHKRPKCFWASYIWWVENWSESGIGRGEGISCNVVWSHIILDCCPPKQWYLIFYSLAICKFFSCLLKFNKSRNGLETTWRPIRALSQPLLSPNAPVGLQQGLWSSMLEQQTQGGKENVAKTLKQWQELQVWVYMGCWVEV